MTDPAPLILPHTATSGNPLEPWRYKELDPSNPWYPLPADYADLTQEGKRLARIAAVSRQGTPLEFTAAWDTFRRLYLMTTEEGFFYHKFAPSPPFHYQMIHDMGAYGRNMFGAPRGFAKSIVVGTEPLLFLPLTRPHFRLTLCLATDAMVESRFEKVQEQFQENSYLIGDFGEQKPKRGKGIWNKKYMTLLNGSRLQGFSVTGRKRGARPDLFILDDPEWDDTPGSETAGLVSREKFEIFLFKVVIPMLEKGSSIAWVGTIIGKQSFLHYALYGGDPRFEYWHKRAWYAGDPEDPSPERSRMLWEQKWDPETLLIRKREIGPAAYASEYMNEVVNEGERLMPLDPRKNYYLVERPDEVYQTDPLHSTSPIHSFHLDPSKGWSWVERTMEARKWLAGLFTILTVDVAKTISPHSDFSCVCASGFDPENTLWLLDMWLGRAPRAALLNQIYRIGYKWRARVIGIESIGEQIAVAESAKTMMEERRIEGWEPRVMPVDYQGSGDRLKKGQRIGTLEWRFPRGRIKLPINWVKEWPWTELIAEIKDFTYDLMMLAHDDALDTVAMTHYVVHGHGVEGVPAPAKLTLAQQIARGDVYVAGRIPRLHALNAEEITEDVLAALLTLAYRRGHHGGAVPRFVRPPYTVERFRRDPRRFERTSNHVYPLGYDRPHTSGNPPRGGEPAGAVVAGVEPQRGLPPGVTWPGGAGTG